MKTYHLLFTISYSTQPKHIHPSEKREPYQKSLRRQSFFFFFFRCQALHRGVPLKSLNKPTRALMRHWYISQGIPLKYKCALVTLVQIPLLEDLF